MKYVFYPDGPPLEHGGNANHSTAWSWAQAMKGNIALMITRRFHRSIDPEAVRKSSDIPTLFFPDFAWLGLRRISDSLRGALDTLLFILYLPWLANTVRESGADRIFLFPSGWWFSLLNALLLGWATGLPVDIFVADDLVALAVLANRPQRARIAALAERFLLPRFAKIYTLSRGQGELYHQKYGLNSTWLPLAIRTSDIEYSPPSQDGAIRYIGFSGSMNEYYAEALVELNQVVVHLNQTTPHRYKIALCVLYPELPDFFPDPSVIELFVNLPNAQIVERLKLNYANYLPFSYSESLRTLVSTSFSCKSAEYFAAGRPIIVYGPAYSSISRHFIDNDLPLVETTRGKLESLITGVDAVDNPALIARYRDLVRKYHSPEGLRQRLVPSEESASSNESAGIDLPTPPHFSKDASH